MESSSRYAVIEQFMHHRNIRIREPFVSRVVRAMVRETGHLFQAEAIFLDEFIRGTVLTKFCVVGGELVGDACFRPKCLYVGSRASKFL